MMGEEVLKNTPNVKNKKMMMKNHKQLGDIN